MSTSHALIDLVDEIRESMDTQLYTLGVFIDLKKHLILWITPYYYKS